MWRTGMGLASALALAVGTAAAQPPAGDPVGVRVDTRGRDSTVRVFVTGGVDAARMAEALRELQRVEARVRADLLAARAAGEAARAAALARQLQELAARRFTTGSELALWCAKESPATAPDGWLGVTFADEAVRELRVDMRDGARTVRYRFAPAPRIDYVDPASPAARAGVREGDILLAIGGVVVGDEPMDLGSLLRPGARLPVRVRRDGSERTLAVTVERRPAAPAANATCGERDFTVLGPADEGSGARATAAARPRPPGSGSWGNAPRTAFAFTGATFLAGAELEPLDESKRELTGVRSGLFVARVAPGTPAATAGLKWGDVIVKVGDAPVTDFSVIRDALMKGAGQPLALEVSRLGKVRSVTLLRREER